MRITMIIENEVHCLVTLYAREIAIVGIVGSVIIIIEKWRKVGRLSQPCVACAGQLDML
jgi:hypothetical protein